MTLYEILGVERDAKFAFILAAYRQAAKFHHPDKGGEESEFKEIQHAFEVLSNPERRARYDETGSVDEVKNQDEEVICRVGGLLHSHLQPIISSGGDATKVDVLGLVRSALEAQRMTAERVIGEMQASIKMLTEVSGRITAEGCENHLAQIVMNPVPDLTKSIEKAKAELDLLTKCLKYLTAYKYERAKPEHRYVRRIQPMTMTFDPA